MADLNVKVEIMAKDIEYLKSEVGEIKQLLKDHTADENIIWEKVMNQLTEQMAKKANVWVEDAFKWGLYIVAGLVLTAIVGLVITSGKVHL